MAGKTYLLEAYLSKSITDGPAGSADRAVLAAEEMRREGTSVRYLRAIFIPQDGTCFHVFEARSEQDVRNAAARAGIDAGRVLEATNFEARDHAPRRAARGLKEER